MQSSDLEPIVRQILKQPAVEILDWHIQRFGGGAAEHLTGGRGIHHITGTARHDTDVSPWSVVVKAMRANDDEGGNDPTLWSYWKREALAYQSGVLEELPGGVVAPRCYHIQETEDGTLRLWLEDIQGVINDWSMAHDQLAARHLGQFNGAYLAGHALPEPTSWMVPGRTHQWIELFSPDKEKLYQFSETKLGRWLSKDSIERIARLWANRQALLSVFDRLPTCFCHHDAHRRNLLLRQTDNGHLETVAIDWAFIGPGKLGQEIGITTAMNLLFLEVAASRASELGETIFDSYIDGLHDAGWQGDRQLARFGYVTSAALTIGVAAAVGNSDILQSADGTAMFEAIIGYPIDDIVEQWAQVQSYLLDLGDEALELMPST